MPQWVSTINLYPNPANASITLEGMKAGTALTLYNTLGQELKHSTATHSNETLNLSGYPGGVYIIHIQAPDGGMTRKKFVKE